jgi:L-asparaginase II
MTALTGPPEAAESGAAITTCREPHPAADRTALPVVIEVIRSGFVESHHRASGVLLDAEGSVALAWGEPDTPVFPRSALKPLQAAAMVRAGLASSGEDLAIAGASHDGAPIHAAAAQRILSAAGLTEAHLQCPPDFPESPEEMERFIRDGGTREALRHNCSGKHASMLSTCVHAGWPVESYLDPEHPLQKAIRAHIEDLAAEKISASGVDGCGAPVHAVSLTGLARAYSAITRAASGTAERAVADAMRAHPHMVAGTGRDVTQLMQAVPGLLAKDGAEAVYAAALADGRAVAFKIEDGTLRGTPPLLAAVLRHWGYDNETIARWAEVPLLGGGRPVGFIRVVREFLDALAGGAR